MSGTYFKRGSWNVICDVCGKRYKADEVRKRWDGLLVCPADFEQRHIADFIRVPSEVNNIKDARPEASDALIYVCYLEASQGKADLGEADCSRADVVLDKAVLK